MSSNAGLPRLMSARRLSCGVRLRSEDANSWPAEESVWLISAKESPMIASSWRTNESSARTSARARPQRVNASDCDAQTSGRTGRAPAPGGSKPTSTVRRRKPSRVATTTNPDHDGDVVEFRFNIKRQRQQFGVHKYIFV